MNDVLGHHLILVAAATAIWTMSYVSGWPRRAVQPEPEATAIVIVPQTEQRSSAPSGVPVPQDMASVIREIQRELKRLSCYDGELNGKWNATSRQAIKSFADQVNAKLPVDRPDYILLRLGATARLPALVDHDRARQGEGSTQGPEGRPTRVHGNDNDLRRRAIGLRR